MHHEVLTLETLDYFIFLLKNKIKYIHKSGNSLRKELFSFLFASWVCNRRTRYDRKDWNLCENRLHKIAQNKMYNYLTWRLLSENLLRKPLEVFVSLNKCNLKLKSKDTDGAPFYWYKTISSIKFSWLNPNQKTNPMKLFVHSRPSVWGKESEG